MSAEYITGTRTSCTAMRAADRRFWYCQIGAINWTGHRCECVAVFDFWMVCDDFGNLVRVQQ